MTPAAEAQTRALRDAAFGALERSYSPYSRFRVGAALLAADGSIVIGCNVENASFGGCMCAERNAVAAAVARGLREFRQIVVATEAEEPTPPCGICRQVLAEFAPSGALPVMSITRGGRGARWTLAELMPHPFTPSSMAST